MKLHRYLFISGLCALTTLYSSCKKDLEINTEPQTFISDMTGRINCDSMKANVIWLENMQSRFALNNNRKDIALQLQQKFIKYGYANAVIDSFYISGTYNGSSYSTWQYNVIASITGTDYPDQICIAGAHYDCINDEGDAYTQAPGADDNASGMSSVLEIARVVKLNNIAPKNTITFIGFAAEELDLNGSADYAAKLKTASKSIKIMLNLDMIAYEPDTDQDKWEVNIMYYDNSEGFYYQAAAITRAYTSLTPVNDNKYNEEGDSYPFYQQGYPALFMISYDENPNYHTANDVSAHCNFEYLCQVAKLNCAMLLYQGQ